jgi:hypothetical protein
MVVVEIDLDQFKGTIDWRVIAPVAPKADVHIQPVKVPIEGNHAATQILPARKQDHGSGSDSEGEVDNKQQQNKGSKRGIFDQIISKWSCLASNPFGDANEVRITSKFEWVEADDKKCHCQ